MNRTVLHLCLTMMAIAAQQNAAAIIIPTFLVTNGFELAAIGTMVALVPVFTLVARFPAGFIYARKRAGSLMIASLFVVSIANCLFGHATTTASFVAVSALSGLANGLATTVFLSFFIDVLPENQNRAQAMGYYAGSIALGFALGGFAVGYITDIFGYNNGFYFSALLAVLAITQMPFLAKLLPQNDDATTDPDQAMGLGRSGQVRRMFGHLMHPAVAAVILVAIFLNMLHRVVATIFPLYGVEIGLSLTQIGVVLGSYALCNAIVRPFSGVIVERFGHKTVCNFGLLLQVAAVMFFPLFGATASFIAVAVLAGSFRAVVMVGNTIGMVEDMGEPRFSRGVASGVFNAANDIGHILGPGFAGLVAAFSGVKHTFFVAPLLIGAVFAATLLACNLFLGRHRGGETG